LRTSAETHREKCEQKRARRTDFMGWGTTCLHLAELDSRHVSMICRTVYTSSKGYVAQAAAIKSPEKPRRVSLIVSYD
jgi:hypothetical protein